MLLFIGAPEILVVVVVVLLLFGSKSLPELAKTFGKGVREFKKATGEIKREFNAEVDKSKNIKNISKDIGNIKESLIDTLDITKIDDGKTKKG